MAGKKTRAAKQAYVAKKLAKAPRSEFRRLTPAENAKLGFSPKARHYVLGTTKRLTKATPTISARQFERKRASELFGLSPEQAERRRGEEARSTMPRQVNLGERVREGGAHADDQAYSRRGRRRARAFQTIPQIRVSMVGRSCSAPGRRRAVSRIEATAACRRRIANRRLGLDDGRRRVFRRPDVGFMRGSPTSGGFGFAA